MFIAIEWVRNKTFCFPWPYRPAIESGRIDHRTWHDKCSLNRRSYQHRTYQWNGMDLDKRRHVEKYLAERKYIPPFIGGNPRPNTAPMSPSVYKNTFKDRRHIIEMTARLRTGEVIIFSSRHRAASFKNRRPVRHWISSMEFLNIDKVSFFERKSPSESPSIYSCLLSSA